MQDGRYTGKVIKAGVLRMERMEYGQKRSQRAMIMKYIVMDER